MTRKLAAIHDNFCLGVNYWPRSSGVQMWRRFDIEEIEEEFALMHKLGFNTVRIFPLWNDFQPIYELPQCGNIPGSLGFREDWNVNPDNNPEMLDPEMLGKFEAVLALAGKYDLKLIVALLTAWMSGTLFNPSWRGGRNHFQDSFMLKYQMLYCRAFARRYAGREEILAWEYGNEQNCVDRCASPETAWVWLHALGAELKSGDPETPVASGMHGLVNYPEGPHVWSITDQADAVDILTTHPYPAFTPGCFLDSLTDLRANLHATVESRYYEDLGGRLTICEEMGVLGKSVLSESLTADFLRMALYSLFANQIQGCLWWSFSEFACAQDLPYQRVQMENDGLGIIRMNGQPKPAALEMQKFSQVVRKFEGRMPPQKRQTAIIVSDLQDDWPSLYNCWVLCVQAGLAPKFVRPDRDSLKEFSLFLIPSLNGVESISVPALNAVSRAVREQGGVMYVSGYALSLKDMEDWFGIREMERIPSLSGTETVSFNAGFTYDFQTKFRQRLIAADGETEAVYADGSPAMVSRNLGKGRACYLSMPLEAALAAEPFAQMRFQAWKLYEMLKNQAGVEMTVDCPEPRWERYWNCKEENCGFLTVINHAREKVVCRLQTQRKIRKIELEAGIAYENRQQITLDALQAAILKIFF